jgi:hypothetical protein
MVKVILMFFLCLATVQLRGEDLENWLRSLPQVKNITSYRTTNSDCTLICMRQIHPNPFHSDESKEKYGLLLKSVRDDIFATSTNLQSHLGISSYYVEGYIAGLTNSVNEDIREDRMLFKSDQIQRQQDENERRQAGLELAQLLKQPGSETNAGSAQMMTLLKRILSIPPRSYYGDSIWDIQQTLYLAVASTLNVRVTEDTTAYMQGLKEMEKVKNEEVTIMQSDEFQRLVLRNREQGVLRTIAADYANGAVTNRYALVIFGGMHDFTRSIQDWNSTNSFKFSLITVTPREASCPASQEHWPG